MAWSVGNNEFSFGGREITIGNVDRYALFPFGLKTVDLLKRKGYAVDDHTLTSREEIDAFKARYDVTVEMVETAAILNRATDRSLVILDEIGRGTATFDGLSIAWAAIEHLHDVNLCRSLFATHYHELTVLANKLPRLSTHAMRIKEWKGDIVFLHEVIAGSADRSYGIAVAKLAGLPAPVIRRADEILKALEASEQGSAVARLADDLPLFAATMSQSDDDDEEAGRSPLAVALEEIAPDELTPREALEALYKLKALLRDA